MNNEIKDEDLFVKPHLHKTICWWQVWAINPTEMVLPECGLFCQVEFAHIMDKRVNQIINGEVSIYEVGIHCSSAQGPNRC